VDFRENIRVNTSPVANNEIVAGSGAGVGAGGGVPPPSAGLATDTLSISGLSPANSELVVSVNFSNVEAESAIKSKEKIL